MLMVVGPRKWIYKEKCRVRGYWYDITAFVRLIGIKCRRALPKIFPRRVSSIAFFSPRISANIVSLCTVIYEAITLVFRRRGGLFLSQCQRNKFFPRIPFSKTTSPRLSEFNRFADILRSRTVTNYYSSFSWLRPVMRKLRTRIGFTCAA